MNLLAQFASLPAIQTRKALILLDFQNDFLRSSGALHVPNTADFVDSLPQLASAFRRHGDIFWVRSHYKTRRPLIGPDAQVPIVLGLSRDPTRASEPDPSIDEEAFLSTEHPQCCRPQSAGVRFPAPILSAIEHEADIIVDKSEYSALQNESLILSLRTRFVTTIYLCGSLSNGSVYATALDAVRHGFAVVLIEDCLGFRRFSRHEEAMRRMADIFGASGITTQELYEELDWQETDTISPEPGLGVPCSVAPAGIERAMDELGFKRSRRSDRRREELDGRESRSTGRTLDYSLSTYSDDGNPLDFAQMSRGYAHHTSPGPPRASTENKPRIRVRRSKHSDQQPEPSSRSSHGRSNKSKQSQDIRKPENRTQEGDTSKVYNLDLSADAVEKALKKLV